jgi:hypothetical protein
VSTQIIDEHEQSVRTNLPVHVDTEDPMIVFYELSLSMRQMLLLLATAFAWLMPSMLTAQILPFLPLPLSLIVYSWLLIGGLWLTFWRKQGLPVELYVSDMVLFKIAEQKLYLPEDDTNGLLVAMPVWSLV